MDCRKRHVVVGHLLRLHEGFLWLAQRRREYSCHHVLRIPCADALFLPAKAGEVGRIASASSLSRDD